MYCPFVSPISFIQIILPLGKMAKVEFKRESSFIMESAFQGSLLVFRGFMQGQTGGHIPLGVSAWGGSGLEAAKRIGQLAGEV